MVAVTYGVARVATAKGVAKTVAKTVAKRAERPASKAAGKSWFARVLDAIIAARMEQARREVRMHIGFLPYSLDERGNRLVKTDADKLPFGDR